MDLLPLVNGQNMAYIINRNMPFGVTREFVLSSAGHSEKKMKAFVLSTYTPFYITTQCNKSRLLPDL